MKSQLEKKNSPGLCTHFAEQLLVLLSLLEAKAQAKISLSHGEKG